MPRRKGWDLAQVKSTFAADPEWRKLARISNDDATYYAAAGLWLHATARAWECDCDDVADVLEDAPADLVQLLAQARLIDGTRLRGFDKWTDAVRRVREADAARKRPPVPPESAGVQRSPEDIPRGEEVEERNLLTSPRPDDVCDQHWKITGTYPSALAQTIYDEALALARGNHAAVIDAMRVAWGQRDEPGTLAKRTKNLILREARRSSATADALERRDEVARNKTKREAPAVLREMPAEPTVDDEEAYRKWKAEHGK